jgi:hypothetical protein
LLNSWPLPLKTKNVAWASGPVNMFAIPTAPDLGAMGRLLERKGIWYRTDAEKKPVAPPKLTEAERDLLAHVEQGYQLETDPLGRNPILRRLKGDEVVRPLSA